MSYQTIHEVPGHPAFGFRVTVCTNTETVCDGVDLDGLDADEVCSEATDAAGEVCAKLLGDLPDYSSYFADWHGGRFAGHNSGRVGYGGVVIDLLHRASFVAGDGIDDWDDWRWDVTFDEAPGAVRDIAEKLADDMVQAIAATIERCSTNNEGN